MINNVEHLYLYVIAWWSPLEKCLFGSSTHFLTVLFVFDIEL